MLPGSDLQNKQGFYIYDSLCPRGFENVRPLLWVEELGVKPRGKIRVAEPRRVILGHVAYTPGVRWLLTLPVPPEPLAVEAGDREHPPVDENPHLGFVEP